MSKNNNVKPDHFKTRGREPQGQDVPHEVVRQAYGKEASLKDVGVKGVRKGKPKGTPRGS